MKALPNLKPQVLGKFVLFGSLLAVMYHPAYSWLIRKDWPREDYNYCYLIPLVVLYLIWEKKDELAAEPSVPSWGGLLLLVPGILLFWVGELAGELYSLYLSSWLVAVGILWLHIGWRKLKTIAFALCMALAMFPLPVFLNTKLTFGLKLISSKLGVAMLHLYGMSAYREGNIIDLGFTQLQVVDACSGLRYLYPLLVMGILISYFYRAAIWKRLVLIASTVPLTIVVNSLRIAITGVIHRHFGAAVAEGFFHGFSGWLIFMFTLAVLLAEVWVLMRIAPDASESFFARPGSAKLREVVPEVEAPAGEGKWTGFFKPPQFVVAMFLMVVTLGVYQAVEFREKIPVSRPLSDFPLTVGPWSGTRQTMEQDIIKELDVSDYAMIDFRDSGNRYVNFYVAWYESQRRGESIHSPETCMPAGGWTFRQSGAVSVSLSNLGKQMNVNKGILEKSGVIQVSYFWFPARGRILLNAWEMKLYTFWDSLTRQRTDGALVRLITPLYPDERTEDAEARLKGFTALIVPVLDTFLPK